VALSRALDEHTGGGGVEGRGQCYAHNHRILVEGMEALGVRCLLEQSVRAPIIVTFLTPADPNFSFDRFYRLLANAGFLIYPGKLTVADSFRVGCIGDLGVHEMRAALLGGRC
jgi:2-aminoethylphosphonate-pyruvate transaminase